jgi:hypothetical protein
LYAFCTRAIRAGRRTARIWLYERKPTEGFEPSTPALRERCSGQLSYVGVGDECSPGLRLHGRAGNIQPMPAEHSSKLAAALDPRVPIYRDAYNEYFVFLLSAGGAIAGTQVPLYIVMALTSLWNVLVFVAACVVFELAVIFGLARPQMKPQERVGWVLLWGAATALFAVLFYYLVAKPTL